MCPVVLYVRGRLARRASRTHTTHGAVLEIPSQANINERTREAITLCRLFEVSQQVRERARGARWLSGAHRCELRDRGRTSLHLESPSPRVPVGIHAEGQSRWGGRHGRAATARCASRRGTGGDLRAATTPAPDRHCSREDRCCPPRVDRCPADLPRYVAAPLAQRGPSALWPDIMWTVKVDARTVTKVLSEDELDGYRAEIDNSRHLGELVDELHTATVPAVKGRSRPPALTRFHSDVPWSAAPLVSAGDVGARWRLQRRERRC